MHKFDVQTFGKFWLQVLFELHNACRLNIYLIFGVYVSSDNLSYVKKVIGYVFY